VERLYDLTAELAVAGGLLPFELLEIARGRSGRALLRSRLGNAPALPAVPAPGRRILIHAVSTGEMSAAGALARGWTERFPEDRIVLAAGNAEGLAAGGRLAAEIAAIDAVLPLPWDRRRALRHWLRAIAPALVAIVETEIWPGLFRATAELGIPLALASARVYPRDVRRYRLALPFFRRTLSIPAWIGAQSEGERSRLLAIGAPAERLEVAGDLKLAALAPRPRSALPAKAPDEIWCAGASTHPREESLLLDAFAAVRPRFAKLRLLLAPRHVRRAPQIAALARRRGFAVASLEDAGDRAWDVLVVDRMGLLAALLERSEIAVLGGTIAARRGQSPIEAARAGCAIVCGPHADHIEERVESWERRRAIARLTAADDLAPVLERLLADEAGRRRMGEAAASAVREEDPLALYVERLDALARAVTSASRSAPTSRAPSR
jgi:3-deoxy-D-manno-octulosonic-acid transferase